MNDIVSGGKEKSRTPEEKAMSRLRNWLICDDRPRLWSGSPNPNGPLPWSEMVCIFAGLDPEASADADASGLAFLPGALESYGFKEGFPKDPEGVMELNAGVAEQTGMLIGFRLTSMTPQDAIGQMVRVGFPIPWLSHAVADPACAVHLPRDIPADYGRRHRSPLSVSQAKKREAQLESDPKQKMIFGPGREKFDELFASGFQGLKKKSGSRNVTAIAKEIADSAEKKVLSEPEIWPETDFWPSARTWHKYVDELLIFTQK